MEPPPAAPPRGHRARRALRTRMASDPAHTARNPRAPYRPAYAVAMFERYRTDPQVAQLSDWYRLEHGKPGPGRLREQAYQVGVSERRLALGVGSCDVRPLLRLLDCI
jgi:hypothetical protein